MGLNLSNIKGFENSVKPAEVKKESVAAPVVPASTMLSLMSCIMINKDKLNASIVSVPNVAVSYLLFKTAKNKLLLFDDCDKLSFNETEVSSIIVTSSGFIITGVQYKTFVSKTNVIQFSIVNGLPSVYTKYGKNGKVIETETATNQYNDMIGIMLLIRGMCPKVFEVCKDMSNKKLILEKIKEFEEKLVDINYSIKINRNLLMKVNFNN